MIDCCKKPRVSHQIFTFIRPTLDSLPFLITFAYILSALIMLKTKWVDKASTATKNDRNKIIYTWHLAYARPKDAINERSSAQFTVCCTTIWFMNYVPAAASLLLLYTNTHTLSLRFSGSLIQKIHNNQHTNDAGKRMSWIYTFFLYFHFFFFASPISYSFMVLNNILIFGVAIRGRVIEEDERERKVYEKNNRGKLPLT